MLRHSVAPGKVTRKTQSFDVPTVGTSVTFVHAEAAKSALYSDRWSERSEITYYELPHLFQAFCQLSKGKAINRLFK